MFSLALFNNHHSACTGSHFTNFASVASSLHYTDSIHRSSDNNVTIMFICILYCFFLNIFSSCFKQLNLPPTRGSKCETTFVSSEYDEFCIGSAITCCQLIGKLTISDHMQLE